MGENMDLWNSVKETNREHTKKVNQRGGYTSISPQSQLLKATEVFGTYGKGFGFEKINFDFTLRDTDKLVLVNAVFFYVLNGERITFPIMNSWQISQGARTDPDFAKKAETNTMSKALSKLGFNADVFMGEFDDNEYLKELAANDRPVKIEELTNMAKSYAKSYASNSLPNSLEAQNNGHITSINRFAKKHDINPTPYIKLVNDSCRERVAELKQQKESKQ